MNLIDTPLMQRLSHFLDATAYRSGIIAENIANIDTPGYHARDLDFRSQLTSLMSDERSRPRRASPKSPGSPSVLTATTSTWIARVSRSGRCNCNFRPASRS